MGTDIHFRMERWQVGAWHVVPPPMRDLVKYPLTAEDRKDIEDGESPWWGPGHGMITLPCWECRRRTPSGVVPSDDQGGSDLQRGPGCTRCVGTGYALDWWHARHYRLFGALCGIRDQPALGVAVTGQFVQFNDSQRPWTVHHRGLPLDVSTEVREDLEDEHSQTWASLCELLMYDWLGAGVPEFGRYVEELLTPILPTSWHEMRMVLQDGLQETTEHAELRDIRAKMVIMERRVRAVWAFDS